MDSGNWLFREGDIITAFLPQHQWLGKKVIVKSVEGKKGKLWGELPIENSLSAAENPVGLTLIRRNGLFFEIKDKVIVLNKKALKVDIQVGEVGEIIVINPEEGITCPFLAEFSNFNSGHEGIFGWSYPWFPDQYKTSSRSRLWIRGDGADGVEKYLP